MFIKSSAIPSSRIYKGMCQFVLVQNRSYDFSCVHEQITHARNCTRTKCHILSYNLILENMGTVCRQTRRSSSQDFLHAKPRCTKTYPCVGDLVLLCVLATGITKRGGPVSSITQKCPGKNSTTRCILCGYPVCSRYRGVT